MNDIEKIVFLKSAKDGRKQMEACVFYSNHTLKYMSFEEAIKQLMKSGIKDIYDLSSYDQVEILKKDQFEQKYKDEICTRKQIVSYNEFVKLQRKLERDQKRRKKSVGSKKKSSLKELFLNKLSFVKRPIKKAVLIGSVAITGFIGFKTYQNQNSQQVLNVGKTTVKNLEISTSNIQNNDYVLTKENKQREEKPQIITINKGIEKEHLETEFQAQKKRIKYIKYYSKVYNLNKKKVINIIKNTTNILSEESLNKKIKDSKIEFKILNKVKYIYENSSSYQKSYGNLLKNNYEKKRTYREMARHYAKLYGVDANKALAIEFHESGYLKANIASVKHNPGAKRRSDGEYYTYSNMEQGIIEHMITLSHYKGQSIQEMASRYSGSKTGASSWAKDVQSQYDRLENDANYYTLADEQNVYQKK